MTIAISVRAKHSGTKFFILFQRLYAVMLRPYRFLWSIQQKNAVKNFFGNLKVDLGAFRGDPDGGGRLYKRPYA